MHAESRKLRVDDPEAIPISSCRFLLDFPRLFRANRSRGSIFFSFSQTSRFAKSWQGYYRRVRGVVKRTLQFAECFVVNIMGRSEGYKSGSSVSVKAAGSRKLENDYMATSSAEGKTAPVKGSNAYTFLSREKKLCPRCDKACHRRLYVLARVHICTCIHTLPGR